MKKYRFMGVSLAAMMVLAACANPSTMTEEEREVLRGKDTISGSLGSGSADYGNATKANMASHIIDPAPANAEDPPKVDGQVVISGYGRYRTGKVKPPERIGGF